MEHLNQLFLDAGTLMLAGMVFVFVFLGLLVIFINTVLARLAIKFPDAIAQTRSRTKTSGTNNKNSNVIKGASPDVVAAITASVGQYRQQNSQQNIKK